jgi:membrane-associated phospholipid phosphatase
LSLRRFLFGLRLEEAITLVFFVPMAYTLARMSAVQAIADGPAAGYPGSFARLVALVAATAFFIWLVRFRPKWELLRDAMPFVFCANVYANLHDLIRFYGARDITADLYRWDLMIFGVEPTIWVERFIHPFLTDSFTFCYWLFYVCGPLLGLLLYIRKDWKAFRYTMVSVVLCLYMGYIGYVAWPASAPRLAIPEAFTVALRGGSAFLDSTRAATAAIPLTAQGTFPSLHCAVALLALLLAWRHLRWYFWVQLPFGVGLIVGTVYLRHHWVVDILAGFVLTFVAFWVGPLIEKAWVRLAERSSRVFRPSTSSPSTSSYGRPEPAREAADRASGAGS